MDTNIEIEDIVTDGIKSKQRVKDLGEVFTPENIVKEMCDLVDNAIASEDGITQHDILKKTYLEPSCGTGNFIVEILARKLSLAKQIYTQDISNKYVYIFEAISTIYGVDIQPDNVEETKHRMIDIITTKISDIPSDILESYKYVINQNIQCANTLTSKCIINKDAPLVITDWELNGTNVVQHQFAFEALNTEINTINGYNINNLAASSSKTYTDEIDESEEF